MQHSIYYGRKSAIFKPRKTENGSKSGEKVIVPPNKSKEHAFFSQAVIGDISSNHGAYYVKK